MLGREISQLTASNKGRHDNPEARDDLKIGAQRGNPPCLSSLRPGISENTTFQANTFHSISLSHSETADAGFNP